MEQQILSAENEYKQVDDWLEEKKCNNIMLVCDDSIKFQKSICDYLDRLKTKITITLFQDFQPNPLYENVQDGVTLFRNAKCDAIIAIGGGSAMDVAKCIKLYSNAPGNGDNGEWIGLLFENNIPLLAVPTTAGTGSEATRYAVIYYEGKKQSITSKSFIPNAVLMDPKTLITLPDYQKKATMMDALCHAIESYWSVNSTDESKRYSKEAIKGILYNLNGYLNNEMECLSGMLLAANNAGKAINITQTTAAHAFSYKITSLYKLPHGHAVAVCLSVIWRYMIDHYDNCIDSRGKDYLEWIFNEISKAMGCVNPREAIATFEQMMVEMELNNPIAGEREIELQALSTSVNPVRLKNNPIGIDEKEAYKLYSVIVH